MHIPDGYLSPQTYLPLYGASTILWTYGARKIRVSLSAREVPYVAMAAAFSFLIQMFNIPIPGGTTGHAVGSGVIALLMGPWTALMATSVALIIQALVFGDGGITALGANCFNMAFVMPFATYYLFLLLTRWTRNRKAVIAAAFLSAYTGLTLSAFCTAVEFGIQPLIAHSPEGIPLYAPYPLSIAVPAMLAGHLFLFGPVEGVVTALLLKYFLDQEPGFIYGLKRIKGDQ
jgi:cobalt/nickel transport system permease protein